MISKIGYSNIIKLKYNTSYSNIKFCAFKCLKKTPSKNHSNEKLDQQLSCI